LSKWTTERARVASLTRSRRIDDPDLVEARLNLKVIRLEDYIRNAVESAPPLSPAQRDHLAALLKPRVIGGGN